MMSIERHRIGQPKFILVAGLALAIALHLAGFALTGRTVWIGAIMLTAVIGLVTERSSRFRTGLNIGLITLGVILLALIWTG